MRLLHLERALVVSLGFGQLKVQRLQLAKQILVAHNLLLQLTVFPFLGLLQGEQLRLQVVNPPHQLRLLISCLLDLF